MAARTTTTSFSSPKKAPLSLARILKFFPPLLLFAIVAFPINTVKHIYIRPIAGDMSHHITQMEEHTDPSSAEYARLLEEVRQEAQELFRISVAIALILLTLAFPKQIVACFTTRFSLTELLRQVVKYVKGPLVATAVITMLQVTSISFLGTYFDTVAEAEVLTGFSILAFVAYPVFLLLGVAATVIVAASMVDEGCHCVRGLGQAWRLIMQVERKEGFVLVLVTLLLPTILSPLYTVALLYMKQSIGLWLLSADEWYNLVSGVHDLHYAVAASAYCYQGFYHLQAMESKDAVAVSDDYAQIPSGEVDV